MIISGELLMNAFILFAIATFYAWWSSRFFGHNVVPQSPTEVVTDGIVLIICALGLVARAVEKQREQK